MSKCWSILDPAFGARTDDFDVSKFKHLQSYEKFVTELGIPGYHFYTGRNSKVLKVRSLTGPERLKGFAHIQIRDLLNKFKLFGMNSTL